MRAVLVGLGAVGARSARQLLSSKAVTELVVLSRQPVQAQARVAALGATGSVRLEELHPISMARALDGAGVLVLAAPGPHRDLAEVCVQASVPVVSISDEPSEVKSLLALDGAARSRSVPVVVGAGLAPGLSCLLAAWAAQRLDQATEVHVATLGTGGPACARRRHAALREAVEEWHDGVWERRVASSGRELVWFPGYAGADCYRVNRPDALLLTLALPSLRAASSRAAASRRDRFTSRLPMLRPPHPEGTVGALRVEVRGKRAGQAEAVVLGARGRPALLAGTVAATVALHAAGGRLRTGAAGLASLVPDPADLLAELCERGTSILAFEGEGPVPAF